MQATNIQLSKTLLQGTSVICTSPIKRGELIYKETPIANILFTDKKCTNLHAVNKTGCSYNIILCATILLKCVVTHSISDLIFIENELCGSMKNIEILKDPIAMDCISSYSNGRQLLELYSAGKVAYQLYLQYFYDTFGYPYDKDMNTSKNMRITHYTCCLVLSRIACNAFTVVTNDPTDPTDIECRPIGIGLYKYASKFNHSCVPNAVQSFQYDTYNRSKHNKFDINSFYICIYANCDIYPGDEVSISYMDLGKPTWWRRSYLKHYYNFTCYCYRCCMFDVYDGMKCTYDLGSGHHASLDCEISKSKSRCKHICYLSDAVSISDYYEWLYRPCWDTSSIDAAKLLKCDFTLPFGYRLHKYAHIKKLDAAYGLKSKPVSERGVTNICRVPIARKTVRVTCSDITAKQLQYLNFRFYPSALTVRCIDCGADHCVGKSLNHPYETIGKTEPFYDLFDIHERYLEYSFACDSGIVSTSKLQSIYDLLKCCVHVSHYAMMDISTVLTTAYLSQHEYIKSFLICKDSYISCMYSYMNSNHIRNWHHNHQNAKQGCKSSKQVNNSMATKQNKYMYLGCYHHPVIGIQLLQYYKLVLHISDVYPMYLRECNVHVKPVLELRDKGLFILKNIYGGDSSVVQAANSVL